MQRLYFGKFSADIDDSRCHGLYRGREPIGLSDVPRKVLFILLRHRPRPVPAKTLLLAASVCLLAAPGAMAQAPAERAPLHWSPPPLLPPGALLAVVSGDPTAPGQSTIELAMPNGYRLPPHFHPSYEHVEVKEGTLMVGMGDRLDPKQTRPLAAGDSATAPAGMHHFSIAKGRTVLLVTFLGPYTITYLRAEDAPRPRVFPLGY